MKKIFTTIVIASLTLGAMAQEAGDKKVQAGLVLGGGMNFNKLGTNLTSRDGVGGDFTVGMNLNWNFQPNIALTTGIEFDIENFSYTNFSQNTFYNFNDKEILLNESDLAGSDVFQLETRKYKAKYLSIPLMLRFQTNFIGYFRYFGKFGLRNSILLGSKVDDIGTVDPFGTPSSAQNFNMVASKDLFIFKSAVGGAIGAEWNFTGATCLAVEIGYYYGFTPIHQENDGGESDANNGTGGKQRHLFNFDSSLAREYKAIDATQGQLQIKASILF